MFISESQKKLLVLLADAQFHSGTELAEHLGVSRSTVCKQLNQLDALGLVLNAVTGKGYCLVMPLQLLSELPLRQALTSEAEALIQYLTIYDCIDSTNRYLMQYSQASLSGAMVCFAEYQTAGKGRRGREWVSPFGHNIYLSIRWQFQQGAAAISGLSLAVGVAVIRALHDCGIENVGLKWPNDIYWQHKKLAGLLIEVSGEMNGACHAVIGLGLNLYMPAKTGEAITQDWIDLQQILGESAHYLRHKLSACLLNHLLPLIATFEQQGLSAYIEAWRKYDCMQGQQVSLYLGNQIFEGCIEGINDEGLLLLKQDTGQVKAFASGEVSFQQS